MRNFIRYIVPAALFVFLAATPASASTLVVGMITPVSAAVNVAQTYSATYSSAYTVTNCTLYVDGSSQGSMALTGDLAGIATMAYTFTTSGSHAAYANCSDSYGDVTSGASVAITVSSSSDVTLPSTPTNLALVTASSDNTPTFTWSASTDNVAVTGYDVSLDGGSYASIGNTTTYTAGIQTNGTHTFAVRARDAGGNVSASTSIAYTIAVSGSGSIVLTPPFGLTQMSADALLIVSASRADLELTTGRACEWAALDASAKVSAVFGAISDVNVRAAIENFAACGTVSTHFLGAGERLGIVNSFKSAFGRVPSGSADWNDVIKIGNGRFTAMISASAEAAAKITFKKIYLRDANMSVTADANAVIVMAYGLRPQPRNLSSEAAAILTFEAVYGHAPVTASEWDAVRATAYSGATR